MPPRVASWPRKPRDFVTIEELAAPGNDQLPLEEVLDGRRMQTHRVEGCLKEGLGSQAWEQLLHGLPCLSCHSQKGEAFRFLPRILGPPLPSSPSSEKRNTNNSKNQDTAESGSADLQPQNSRG